MTRAPGTQVGGAVGLELGGAGRAQPADRLLEGGADVRVERRRGPRPGPRRAPGCRPARRRRTARSTRGSPRARGSRTSSQIGRTTSERGLDVEVGARHQRRGSPGSRQRLRGGRSGASWGQSRSTGEPGRTRLTALMTVPPAADVPAEHGAVPRGERAAARLRGPLPGAGAPPARRVDDPTERVFGVGRDPRGLRGRRPRRPVAPPDRHRDAADRGRAVPRRPLRHRGGRPAADRGSHDLDTSGRLPGRPWSTCLDEPDDVPRRRGRGRADPGARSRPTGDALGELRGEPVLSGGAAPRPDVPVLVAGRRLPAHAARAAGAARGARRRDPAGPAAPLAASRAARDEGRTRRCRRPRSPAPAGRPTGDGADEVGRRDAGDRRADQGRGRLHRPRLRPRPARRVVRPGGGRRARSRPGRGSSRPCSPTSTARWSSASSPSRGSSTSRRWPRRVGGKRAAMADPAAAERATGYVVGGISPIGQRKRLRTVLDETRRLGRPSTSAAAGGARPRAWPRPTWSACSTHVVARIGRT